MLGDLLLDRIGEEARDDVGRARDDADQETHYGAARDRPCGIAPLLAVRPQLAEFRADHLAGHLMARRRENFAEAEQPDRDRHDADAVAELGDIERIAEMPT